jgi:hypothetical protein
MKPTRDTPYITIRSEGGLLPPDLLARIAASDGLAGLHPQEYGLAKGERLSEAVARAWERARTFWAAWQASREGPGGAGVSELREQWLLPLFKELGYGRLVYRPAAEELDGRRFPISHRAGEDADAPPVHTVAPNGGLDQAARADGSGAPRRSPHGWLQEYLNASPHLWGVVSDGLTLRLLRDNASLSRAAYVEADLEAMFREGAYPDFVLLYLLLHRSRLPSPGQPVETCWLELWRREGEASGARAREALRQGVETALVAFGQGLLEHPDNTALRTRLHSGALKVEDYYRQLLRLVYRLIFLLAAEQRDLLFATGADPRQKRIYADYYAIDRLRDLARRRSTDPHDDLWQGVQTVFRALRDPESAAILGLAPLGGLFDPVQMPDIDGRALTPLPRRPEGTRPVEPGEGEMTSGGVARSDAPAASHVDPPKAPFPAHGGGHSLDGGWGEGSRWGEGASLSNARLLEALRGLGWIEADRALRRVNYRDMDVEELERRAVQLSF